MKIKARIGAMLVPFLVLTLMASGGFAAAQGTPTTGADGEQIVVGLVQIDLSNPFHLGEVDGAKEAARRYGFELVVTSGEGDVTKQIQAVENLINEGVDAISVNFIDVSRSGRPCRRPRRPGSRSSACTVDRGLRRDARLRRALHRPDRRRIRRRAADARSTAKSRARSPTCRAARAGAEHRPLRRLHRRHGAVSGRQGRRAGADQLGSDQAAVDHRELDDRLPDLDLIYGNSDSLTVPAADVVDRAGKAETSCSSRSTAPSLGLNGVKDGAMESTVLLAPQYSGFWKAYFPFLVATGEDAARRS